MHRELVRQPKYPLISTQPPPRPRLVLIQGGKSDDDDPILTLSVAVFLCTLRAFNRRRRRDTPSASVQKEVAVVTTVTSEAIDRVLADAPASPDYRLLTARAIQPVKAKRSPTVWEVSEEVAGQFIRTILVFKGDLDEFLDRATERVMRERAKAKQRFKPYKEVRELEWQALQTHARTIVMKQMSATNRRTIDGYDIRRLYDDALEPVAEAFLCPRGKRIVSIQPVPPRRKRRDNHTGSIRPRRKRAKTFYD